MAKIKIKDKQFRTAGEKVLFSVMFAVFALYSASIIVSMAWAFMQSLKAGKGFYDDMLSLPKKWLFSNYAKALTDIEYSDYNFFGMFINSIWFAAGSSILSVLSHCVTGYIFAKYRFKGRGAAFSFILFTITLPVVGTLPSLYQVIYKMNINDSPLFLITALGGFGGNFLVTYAFFKGIDWSYAEAAFIDGAGHLYVFLRIMLPFAVGPVFALSLLGFIGQWNNYETPILFLDKMPVLSSGLYRFKVDADFEANSQPVLLAAVLLTSLPVLAAVAAFGGKIMKNVTMGGLKG